MDGSYVKTKISLKQYFSAESVRKRDQTGQTDKRGKKEKGKKDEIDEKDGKDENEIKRSGFISFCEIRF